MNPTPCQAVSTKFAAPVANVKTAVLVVVAKSVPRSMTVEAASDAHSQTRAIAEAIRVICSKNCPLAPCANKVISTTQPSSDLMPLRHHLNHFQALLTAPPPDRERRDTGILEGSA